MNGTGIDLNQSVAKIDLCLLYCISAEIIYVNAVIFRGFPSGSVWGQAYNLQSFGDCLYVIFIKTMKAT